MKSILVTGCAGFIGSNFVPYFLEKYPEYLIVNLDLLTYAGDLENLKEIENNHNYKFIKGDICNRELIEFIFTEYDIQGVNGIPNGYIAATEGEIIKEPILGGLCHHYYRSNA